MSYGNLFLIYDLRVIHWFEFKCVLGHLIVDDLPLRGFIGTVEKDPNDDENKHYYLFKHLHFHILYNGDRVIYANITADPQQIQELTDEDVMVEFSYSASWDETGKNT